MIPEQFLDRIDFYMFQSGHNAKGQEMAYLLPESFRKKYPKKPMINAEPCYEQMGFSRKEYGRFEPEDIRKAAWSSILSGACAGVTYGAHGIWNWKKVFSKANPVLGEGFDEPQSWENAIHFPGAWDYGMIRHFLEEQGVNELVPCQNLLEDCAPEIRMAKNQDKYFIYMPFNTTLCIKKEFHDYRCLALDLMDKRVAELTLTEKDGMTRTEMHPFQKDVLLIIEK